MVQFSHPYMTTGKTIALTRWTFVSKVMSLLFNMLSRFVIREGNGTPLQYSCLENPMDGGAWWAAIHGVTNSWTQLHFHFSLSCIGEGNGNPLQCSCLENPRDGGAWWAAVYGVAQSRTRLKRLSSSSSSLILFFLALGLTCLLCVSTRMKASQRPERCFVHCYIPEPRAIINV